MKFMQSKPMTIHSALLFVLLCLLFILSYLYFTVRNQLTVITSQYQKAENDLTNLNTINNKLINRTIFSFPQHRKELHNSCGINKDNYTQTLEQLIRAAGADSRYDISRIGRGEWSDDCKQLVFNFFPTKGWGTEGESSANYDKYVGLWLYDSTTQNAIKLSSDFSEPNYWLTTNLFVTSGDMIIDVITKNHIFNSRAK